MYTLSFTDAHLQKCYDSNLAVTDGLAQDLREIRALIATRELFQMLDGPHSIRTHEIMEHLVSAELRPALRRWYQRPAAETKSFSTEFRNALNKLTGEQLEIPEGPFRQCLSPKTVNHHKKEPICDAPKESKPGNP